MQDQAGAHQGLGAQCGGQAVTWASHNSGIPRMTQLLMRMVTRTSMAAGDTMAAAIISTVTMTQALTFTTTAALTTATITWVVL